LIAVLDRPPVDAGRPRPPFLAGGARAMSADRRRTRLVVSVATIVPRSSQFRQFGLVTLFRGTRSARRGRKPADSCWPEQGGLIAGLNY